jgi:hypothetical protein
MMTGKRKLWVHISHFTVHRQDMRIVNFRTVPPPLAQSGREKPLHMTVFSDSTRSLSLYFTSHPSVSSLILSVCLFLPLTRCLSYFCLSMYFLSLSIRNSYKEKKIIFCPARSECSLSPAQCICEPKFPRTNKIQSPTLSPGIFYYIFEGQKNHCFLFLFSRLSFIFTFLFSL